MSEMNVKEAQKLQTSQVVLNYLFVTIMMLCFSMVLVRAIESVPPGWNGSYVIVLTLLVTCEALISFNTVKKYTVLDANPVVFRLTEWIVILIVVKGLIYLLTDPTQVLVDLPMWRRDFSTFFLNGPYLWICIFLLFIWLFTNAFVNLLEQLGEDPELLESERQGIAGTNRAGTRRGLMGLIFGLGSAMLFFTTITQISNPLVKFLPNPLLADVLLTLLFFVSGFILLARSQLAILNARWYIENIPVVSKINSRWMLYAAFLVFSIAAVVIFLPTSYSLGLLDLGRMLINAVFAFALFLQLVILSPILAFFAMLLRLLGVSQVQPTQEPAPPVNPTPAPIVPGSSPAWFEIAKSILFWGIFLFVVIYSIRHYFIHRQGFLAGLKKFAVFSNFRKAWTWLKNIFLGANNRLSIVVEKSMSRIRQIFNPRSIKFDPLSSISNLLPARQRVQLIYLSLVRWNSHHGINRKNNQTPNEYAHILIDKIPELTRDIYSLTTLFTEARYTRHPISVSQAQTAQVFVDRIQEMVRQQEELSQQTQSESK